MNAIHYMARFKAVELFIPFTSHIRYSAILHYIYQVITFFLQFIIISVCIDFISSVSLALFPCPSLLTLHKCILCIVSGHTSSVKRSFKLGTFFFCIYLKSWNRCAGFLSCVFAAICPSRSNALCGTRSAYGFSFQLHPSRRMLSAFHSVRLYVSPNAKACECRCVVARSKM